jgi:hypothetical protein
MIAGAAMAFSSILVASSGSLGRPGQPGGDGRVVSVIAGTLPVPEFFGPENTERILTGAATGAPS